MRNEPNLVLLIPPRERPAQIFFRRKSFFCSSEQQDKPRAAPHETAANESYPLAPALFEAHAHASTAELHDQGCGKFFSRRAGKNC